MTSSTDQEAALFTAPSLSCFTWSGPVVELAAAVGIHNNENQPDYFITSTDFVVIEAYPPLDAAG